MIRDVVLTRINYFLLAVLALVTAYAFVSVPAGTTIPVHWGVNGQADGFAERTAAFLMLPAISIALVGLVALIVRAASSAQIESGKAGLAVVVSALLVLFVTMQIGMLLIGLGHPVNMVQIIALGMALLLIVVGNVLPKSQPNRYSGIRLPWTVADPANWRATHRLVGGLMMLTGALLMVLAFLPVQPLSLFCGLLSAVLVPIAVGGVYSYRFSKRA